MNFYSIIIGSELLNGRRKDKHFEFLNDELLKRGWTHKGSFVIKDEPHFIELIYKLVQQDPKAVMFSFGGIGATPDDYTRECAANVFSDGAMEYHEKAKELIIEKFGDAAYPHRINMAHLPLKAELLHNPITNIPGFYLEKRFFFVPGFPQMAQAMIVEALNKYYPKNEIKKYRETISAFSNENTFIDIMKQIDEKVDFSSLPIIDNDKRYTVLSIESDDNKLTQREINKFIKFCEARNIEYTHTDMKQYK